ncbi:RNA polymerase sigma factor SigJ [Paenibacillus sp. GCM10027627]|uniref:RNA polymerase sigma factor SigJ n=1 Tax=unclassified Paenibacillus TaxID=185978 RepID=UPI00363FF0F5
MDIEKLYIELKPLLFSLAYQMLGSVADAEDIVQESFITLQENRPDSIQFMKAYMCKTVTNKCLNSLKSSSRRREMYVGPWLPEPLDTGAGLGSDPLDKYIFKESLTVAYLLLLQQLTAVERVVFLLRELFQYPFQDIAEMLGKSSGNCRQIYYRAKMSIGSASNRNIAPKETAAPMAEHFVNAIMSGNFDQLLAIFSAETVMYTDGGGQIKTALRPIVGSTLIVRFFTALRPQVPAIFSCEICELNGNPGIVMKTGEYTFSVISFRYGKHAIEELYIMLNPEKLQHFNQSPPIEG